MSYARRKEGGWVVDFRCLSVGDTEWSDEKGVHKT